MKGVNIFNYIELLFHLLPITLIFNYFQELVKTEEQLRLSFIDDFNTPQALSHLIELISITNGMLNDKCEVNLM